MSRPIEQTPESKLKELLSLDKFNELSAEQQIKEISDIDPDFKDFTPADYNAFRKGIGLKESYSIAQPIPAETGLRGPLNWSETLKNLKFDTQDYIKKRRPIISGVAGGMAGMAAARAGVKGAPLVGSTAMSAVDEGLKYLSGEPPSSAISTELLHKYLDKDIKKGTPQDIGLSMLENTAITDIGGRAVSYGLGKTSTAVKNYLKEIDAKAPFSPTQRVVGTVRDQIVDLFKGIPQTGMPSNAQYGPGSVVNESIRELDPTLSQYFKSSSWFRAIEDIFAPKAKKEALVNSAQQAIKKAEKTAFQITGTPVKLATAQEVLGSDISNEAIANIKMSYAASNRTAEATKLIAEQNPSVHKIMTSPASTKQVATGILDAAGKPILKTVVIPAQFQNIQVKGAVNLNRTVKLVDEFINDMTKSGIKPDPEDPVFKALNDLVEFSGMRIENGKLVHTPVDFDRAWKTKQVAGNLGYGNPLENITVKDSRFRKISQALDQDISDSMLTWQNNGVPAQKLWETTKSIVNKRHAVFNADFETGASVNDLLKTANSPTSSLNKQIDDPKKLSRLLRSGNTSALGITNGTSNYATNTNTRVNAQGYQFTRIINEAFDRGSGQFSKEKLLTSWAEHAASPSGEILWNKKQKEAINGIIQDFAQITDNMGNAGPSRYLTLRLAQNTIQVAAPIVAVGLGSDFYFGSNTAGALGTIGAALTLRQFAKLSTNPDTARIIYAMMKNEPLQMSTEMAGRRILHILKGEILDLQDAKGNSKQGKVNAQGKIVNLKGEEK